MRSKIRVGIVGATGMVGQRLITLLNDHPWFVVKALSASSRSAGKLYKEAVDGRWSQSDPIPVEIGNIRLLSADSDIDRMAETVSLIFSAISADKGYTRALEEKYAQVGLPVVSNNSAHRWTPDVPMLIPEINPHHLDIIPNQQQQRGWSSGFIIVKPNCSIQSYIPLIKAWECFKPRQVIVSTYQAVSGAGKTMDSWPEMQDNVIPFIGGEEEKSENEPLKILGRVNSVGKFDNADSPKISAQCIRVPISDGHMATIHLSFEETVTQQMLIEALENYINPITGLNLPSAPNPFITYYTENDRPQTKLDRDLHRGMGISVGRIRPDPILGWKCVALSHNTLRGAAGGSVLNAELLMEKGLIK